MHSRRLSQPGVKRARREGLTGDGSLPLPCRGCVQKLSWELSEGAMCKNISGGCPECRQSIHGERNLPLVRVLCSVFQDAILYRCQNCGDCWLDTHKTIHVIPEQDARHDFPEAFSGEYHAMTQPVTPTLTPPPLNRPDQRFPAAFHQSASVSRSVVRRLTERFGS
jgi:hypothetical protein